MATNAHSAQNIIATNIILNKMRVTANVQCGFCNDKNDSIELSFFSFFLFFKCACIRRLWTSLKILLNKKLSNSAKCKVYPEPCTV